MLYYSARDSFKHSYILVHLMFLTSADQEVALFFFMVLLYREKLTSIWLLSSILVVIPYIVRRLRELHKSHANIRMTLKAKKSLPHNGKYRLSAQKDKKW